VGGVVLVRALQKERFETSQEAPKVLAENRLYGRVLIIARKEGRWMTVGYDERAKKPVFSGEFSLPDTPAFGVAVAMGLVGKPDRDNVGQTDTLMKGIERTSTICGGDACNGQSRVPVWSLVQARSL